MSEKQETYGPARERTESDVFMHELHERAFHVRTKGTLMSGTGGAILIIGYVFPHNMPDAICIPGNHIGRFTMDHERIRSASGQCLTIARDLFGPTWAPMLPISSEEHDHG